MHRIMIFGRPGSGKSTFAQKLAQKTGLPLYHLGHYFYLPNWQKRPDLEFLADQKRLIAEDAWIIDGNLPDTLHLRYERATVAIYFLMPRLTCYWRILKRRVLQNRAQDDLPKGCSEQIWMSQLQTIWHYDALNKERIARLRSQYPHVRFYQITGDAELGSLMQNLIGD